MIGRSWWITPKITEHRHFVLHPTRTNYTPQSINCYVMMYGLNAVLPNSFVKFRFEWAAATRVDRNRWNRMRSVARSNNVSARLMWLGLRALFPTQWRPPYTSSRYSWTISPRPTAGHGCLVSSVGRPQRKIPD